MAPVLRVETNSGDFEETDPEAVLDRTLDALRMRIEEVDATITAESLPPVEADPNQVGQVFQNLLDNAVEYAGKPASNSRIEVSRTEMTTKLCSPSRTTGRGFRRRTTRRCSTLSIALEHTTRSEPASDWPSASDRPAPRRCERETTVGQTARCWILAAANRSRYRRRRVQRGATGRDLLAEDNPGDVKLTEKALEKGKVLNNRTWSTTASRSYRYSGRR